MQWPKSGPNSAAEYMVSGLPFVTGALSVTSSSPTHVTFPYLTRHIYIRNTGGSNLFAGFTANGVQGTNRFTIPVSGTFGDSMLRIKSLFLLASSGSTTAEVVAGITFVEPQMFPTLTGSVVIGTNQGNLDTWGYPGLRIKHVHFIEVTQKKLKLALFRRNQKNSGSCL